MALKSTASLALFLLLNLLLCAFANACGSCPGSNRRPRGPNNPPGSRGGRNNNPPRSGGGRNNPPRSGGGGGGPNNPPGSGGGGGPNNPGPGGPNNPGPGGPNNPGPGGGPNNPGPGGPNNPTPSPSAGGRCPRDVLKLGVCGNLLNGLLNITIGAPPVTPCCTLIQGLADIEAAVCLCTVIRANILGITLNIPLSLSLLLNVCSRNVPPGFQC